VPPSFLPLKAEDVDRVVAMMAKLYSQGNDAFDAGRVRRATMALLAEPEFGGVWTIEADGAEAGYLVFVMGYSLEFGGRFGLLDELYIEEACRGRGIGKHAMAFAEKQCQARGWGALRLEVGQHNERAIALYSSAGFDMHDRFLMTKWM
jgi:ribosomal protein S18 acetylase RimI-like enzyme